MQPTLREFFNFWRGRALLGWRPTVEPLKREYEHRQRRWVAWVLTLACEEEFKMARGRKNAAPVVEAGDMPIFVNCTMPTNERPKVTKFGQDSEKIWQLVEQLLLDGYKLSWAFDKSRGAYVASLTCRNKDDTNFNQTLSGWSSGWYDALTAVLYKHFVYLSGDWAMALTVKSEDAFG